MSGAFGVPLGAPVAQPEARAPDGRVLEGRFVRLETLNRADHGEALWNAARSEPADRWAYLGDTGPFNDADKAEFDALLASHETSTDPLFYTVIPMGGAPLGWASLMRFDQPNAVIETGWIWLSSALGGTPASTEAHYLLMRHAFEHVGVRRYEWKCNALNAPSCNAANRLGFTFEGTFRQHQITRGLNRDTAWFSILDTEWPRVQAAFETWLSPVNFDEDGRQRQSLSSIRDGL